MLEAPAQRALDLTPALKQITSSLDAMDHRSAKGLGGLLHQLVNQQQTNVTTVLGDSKTSPLAVAFD